jgi:hypothetical protein
LQPDGEFATVEIDIVPGESERLAFAESEDEDQDVAGVKRVAGCAG